ncbi:Uncharacterised protein [Legionella spiritensis]|nr:Uncharacterised protein [Legionella spiritensis]
MDALEILFTEPSTSSCKYPERYPGTIVLLFVSNA